MHIIRHFLFEQEPAKESREISRGGKIHFLGIGEMIFRRCFQRDCQGRNVHGSGFHRRAHRPGNCDPKAHVLAIVDPRGHQDRPLGHDLQYRMLHGLRRRAAYGIDGPLLPVDLQFLFAMMPLEVFGRLRPKPEDCSLGAATVTCPSEPSAPAAAQSPGERMPSSLVRRIGGLFIS